MTVGNSNVAAAFEIRQSCVFTRPNELREADEAIGPSPVHNFSINLDGLPNRSSKFGRPSRTSPAGGLIYPRRLLSAFA